jgi:hypothetical protein
MGAQAGDCINTHHAAKKDGTSGLFLHGTLAAAKEQS